jgi:hypothetical protein
MQLAALGWGLALCFVASPINAQAPVPEAAILRAAIADWQEGPTDGRICLDARMLPPNADRPSASSPVWRAALLEAVLADPSVAIARGTLATASPYRVCSPSRTLPRLSVSRPVRARGGFMVTAAVEYPSRSFASGERLARPFRVRVLIARRSGRWMVVGHPDMPFKVLRAPS